MRILILDEEFPWPLNTGKRIRSYNLAAGLAHNHDVTYLAFGSARSDSFRQFEKSRLNPIAVERELPAKSGPGFYFRLARNLLSAYPYSVDSHFDSCYAAKLGDLLSQHSFDIVLCEWTPYARYVLNRSDVIRVVSAHNIEAQIWQRWAKSVVNPLKRWYLQRQADKMEHFERTVFAAVDAATAVSAPDAETLAGYNQHLDIETIDNGVDLDYFQPATQVPADDTLRLVFTGSMDWRPNQDGASYFAENVLPLLRQKYPDVQAVFVGRNPPAWLYQLGKHSGIVVTGTVEDVRPYIEAASIYIVPLRVGGGSRLKILEALAMGKPVISTTVGAEGLELIPGEHLLVADLPDQWIHAVERILGNGGLRENLSQAGRKLVERRYGWSALVSKLDRFLTKLVDSR